MRRLFLAVVCIFISLCVFASSSPAAQFTIKGTVYGVDGKPMGQKRVVMRDARGAVLPNSGITDPFGNFKIYANQAIGALIFVDRDNGLAAQWPGPWDKDSYVGAGFKTSEFYKIQGRIIDPKGALIAGFLSPGAKWGGEFDHIARKMISINIHVGEVEILDIHPDAKGNFHLSVNFPISSLILKSGGGGVSMKKSGPWKTSATVNFDLSQDQQKASGMFTINGYVRDANGNPKKYNRVVAYDKNNKVITEDTTRSSGRFELKCNQTVYMIKTSLGAQSIERRGKWRASASVDLIPKASNQIHGRVLDSDGKPIARVRVLAYGADGKNLNVASSKSDGSYKMATEKTIQILRAYCDATGQNLEKNGPWPSDGKVDFVFSNKDVFILSGRVTDKNGQPLHRFFISAADSRGHNIKSTSTDKNGYYKIIFSQEVATLCFQGREIVTKNGPWKTDEIINVGVNQ